VFVVVLCFVYHVLSISLYCLFLIVPSVVSVFSLQRVLIQVEMLLHEIRTVLFYLKSKPMRIFVFP